VEREAKATKKLPNSDQLRAQTDGRAQFGLWDNPVTDSPHRAFILKACMVEHEAVKPNLVVSLLPP